MFTFDVNHSMSFLVGTKPHNGTQAVCKNNINMPNFFLDGLRIREYMMVTRKSFRKSGRKVAMSVLDGVEA